jgi:hypothetical protein
MMRDLFRLHRLRTAALVAGVLMVTGCTGDEPKEPTEPTAAAAQESAAPSAAEPAVVQGFDPADAVAELDVAQLGDEATTANIKVLPLQVDGDVMLLRLVVTTHTTDPTTRKTLGAAFFGLLNGFFSPTLRDLDNLKVYSALSGEDLASSETAPLPWDQPTPYYVYFAAPQDDIDSIDLQLARAWPAVTDVPIER